MDCIESSIDDLLDNPFLECLSNFDSENASGQFDADFSGTNEDIDKSTVERI